MKTFPLICSLKFKLTNMGSIKNQLKTDDENFSLVMQLITSSILSHGLQVAIELDLFEIIAKAGPNAKLSPRDIVSHLPTQNPDAPIMLDRILRLLVSYSILNSSIVTNQDGLVERLYGLTPVGEYFARNEDGVSMSPMMLLGHDKVFNDSWYYLKDSILEGGIPFNKAHGMHAFEYPGTDSRFNHLFNEAMVSQTTFIMKKIVDTYRGFEDLKELIDVGGGVGTAISIITSKYPTIRGINFDLPHVNEHAPTYPGVEHVGGDMFASVPNGEAIFLKWILHDWSDESCLKLLKNCYEALPNQGKLIIVEAIVPIAPENDIAAKGLCQIDIGMMTVNPGGKERTEEEYKLMAKGAGFTGIKKVCCIYNHWVIEFYKQKN